MFLLVFAVFEAWGGSKTLCFYKCLLPSGGSFPGNPVQIAQEPCVFTGLWCLRGLGLLKNLVFSQVVAVFEAWDGLKTSCVYGFLLPSRPWGGSQVFAAFEPWGGSKTLSFHKFLLSLRPRGGSKTLRFHRFWLPLRPGAVQKLCVPRGFCCLRGLGRLKNTVFS